MVDSGLIVFVIRRHELVLNELVLQWFNDKILSSLLSLLSVKI